MNTNKQYRDEIAMVTHDIMKDFQQAGAVSDKEMREFENNCFVPCPGSANEPASTKGYGIHIPATT